MTALIIPTEAPAVLGPPQGHWTYADWEALPDDGKRYEIIDGMLYRTTAPSSFHQWIVKRFERYIGIPAEDQGLAYSFAAPIGIIMPGCDPVQPDYVVVLVQNASIIRDRRIRGVPDLIIEVLSPNSVVYDERIKLVAYAMAGVPEYAIVDPRTRVVSRYQLQAPGRYASPDVVGEGGTIAFNCLPTISVPVAELFAGAPDTTL